MANKIPIRQYKYLFLSSSIHIFISLFPYFSRLRIYLTIYSWVFRRFRPTIKREIASVIPTRFLLPLILPLSECVRKARVQPACAPLCKRAFRRSSISGKLCLSGADQRRICRLRSFISEGFHHDSVSLHWVEASGGTGGLGIECWYGVGEGWYKWCDTGVVSVVVLVIWVYSVGMGVVKGGTDVVILEWSGGVVQSGKV